MSVPVLVVDLQSLELDERDLSLLEWVDDDRTVEEISEGAQTSLFDLGNQFFGGDAKFFCGFIHSFLCHTFK